MTARRLHGFFFSSSLCLKMQKLKTREWREKWKGNGETKKMRWMKEDVLWIQKLVIESERRMCLNREEKEE